MGYYREFENNRKSDLIYHLKHGPVIIPAITMFHLFGFEWLNALSEIIGKKIKCTLAGNGRNDVRLEIR